MTRPVASAVIVDEDRVLLTLNRLDGEVYLFPGGELLTGEKISLAVTRHTQDQTGYEAAVHELLWIRESAERGRFLDPPSNHVAEFFYRCSLSGVTASASHGGSPHQVGVDWVSRDRLSGLALLPRSLVEPLDTYLTDRGVTPPVYAVEDF